MALCRKLCEYVYTICRHFRASFSPELLFSSSGIPSFFAFCFSSSPQTHPACRALTLSLAINPPPSFTFVVTPLRETENNFRSSSPPRLLLPRFLLPRLSLRSLALQPCKYTNITVLCPLQTSTLSSFQETMILKSPGCEDVKIKRKFLKNTSDAISSGLKNTNDNISSGEESNSSQIQHLAFIGASVTTCGVIAYWASCRR
jgi:hypothetical protein